MKTEEVIEIKPLEEGDTLIENYKVITHMRRGKDCDLYHLWSEERMCSVIGKTVQPNAAAKEKAAARLTREGELITKLSHPNLLRGYELHRGDVPVVIQETLTGETISHLVRQTYKQGEELPLIQLAQFGKQLSSVINYLHSKDILHLDIKPSNIISQPPLAKLFDLNLVTEPGTVRKGTGTKPYMSPEQAKGDPLTAQADVWGIGVVLFFMATCERPFETFDDGRYEKRSFSLPFGLFFSGTLFIALLARSQALAPLCSVRSLSTVVSPGQSVHSCTQAHLSSHTPLSIS